MAYNILIIYGFLTLLQEGAPEIHLVYRDANYTFNFERDDTITSSLWHSDVSYELQPPGLTTFFLLAQRESSRPVSTC